ncbi:MAG: hypothetical protein ACRDZW_06605 [Acidimicrobiales bacterium]
MVGVNGRNQAVGGLLAVLIAVLLVLGFALLPFEAAGGLNCEAPLRGGDPEEKATEGYLVGREDVACSRRSGSRVTTAAVTGTLFLIIGLGSVFLPESRIERALFGDDDIEELYEE